jgi:hypothetical protein
MISSSKTRVVSVDPEQRSCILWLYNPDWTRKPVAPGESGTIKVSYDPKNRPGAFNKTIRVSSNADNAEVTLRISGKVEPRQKTIAEEYPREIGPLRARSNQISFVKILQTDVLKDSIEVINDSAAPVQLSFKTPPATFRRSLFLQNWSRSKKATWL